MKQKEEKVYDQKAENHEWMNKLFFYEDELAILQRRLQEIAKANTGQEVLQQVEHFQNQLIVQRNNIDSIKRTVKGDEKRLDNEINANPVGSDHRSTGYHGEQLREVEGFEKNFNNLRGEMKKFLLKHL